MAKNLHNTLLLVCMKIHNTQYIDFKIMKKGLVIKKIANKFTVKSEDCIFICSSKGTLKNFGIFVGDNVEFDENTMQITKVSERKNVLIRPPLANLEQMIIVFAPVPKPDYLLIDKLILFCFINGIEPVVCLNKSDICSDEFINESKRAYENIVPLLIVSAKNGDIENLKNRLSGKLSAFAGQSAVGKSNLSKILFPDEGIKIGELSKIERGKNTTRHCEIFEAFGGYFADTPGFTALSETLLGISASELSSYYPDFLKFIPQCKFRSCSHITENNCAIKVAVDKGKIDKLRYERYKVIYENLKKEKRYGKNSTFN